METTNNTFDFVGKLLLSKETQKFKPYEEQTYNSGWVKKTVRLNMICGTNRHLLTIEDGHWKDGHGDIYTFSKSYVDKDGKRIKGEQLIIPFAERFEKKNLNKVAEFKKNVVDLETNLTRRYELKDLLKLVEDGKLTLEDVQREKCTSTEMLLEKVKKELSASLSKKKEYISKVDFAEYVYKLISSDKYKNKIFRVRGSFDITEWNGKYYHNYHPTRIYLVDDGFPSKSEVSLKLFFNKDSIDRLSLDENHEVYVNGFTSSYDNNRKCSIPVPFTITIKIPQEDKKANLIGEMYAKNFAIDDTEEGVWKQMSVKLDALNGAQKVELTEDLLSDNEKIMLEVGAMTLEEIAKERGSEIYSERVRDFVLTGFGEGYLKTGALPTVYTDEDFDLRLIDDRDSLEDAELEDFAEEDESLGEELIDIPDDIFEEDDI